MHTNQGKQNVSGLLRTAMELGRVSNQPTVWTNSIAGAALAGASPTDWRFAIVLLSMAIAYTGGMFLNDAFDASIDAKERPNRPIPSGRAHIRVVFASGYTLLALSVALVALCAFQDNGSGWKAVLSAVALSLCIILYNRWHKGNVLSPLIMGICRMLVYITAGLSMTDLPHSVLYFGAGISLSYLIGLTYTAKQEHFGAIKNFWPLTFLLAPVVYALAYLIEYPNVTLPLMLLSVWLLVVMYFLKRRRPGDIPRAVVGMIAGISLMDAIFIVTVGSDTWALLAIIAFLVTLTLQRWVPGT